MKLHTYFASINSNNKLINTPYPCPQTQSYWCDNDVDDWGSVCWYDGDQDESLTCYDCYAGEYRELCYEE
jgi:hypothetical protein